MNEGMYIPFGSYHEWKGIWNVFLVVAAFITLWNYYKKKQTYQITNYLLFSAALVSAVLFHIVDFQYIFSHGDAEFSFWIMLVRDKHAFTCIMSMFIYFTIAMLIDYKFINISEKNRSRFLIMIVCATLFVLVGLSLFVHLELTLQQKLFTAVAGSLRNFYLFPLFYIVFLEGCRADLMKTKELKNE